MKRTRTPSPTETRESSSCPTLKTKARQRLKRLFRTARKAQKKRRRKRREALPPFKSMAPPARSYPQCRDHPTTCRQRHPAQIKTKSQGLWSLCQVKVPEVVPRQPDQRKDRWASPRRCEGNGIRLFRQRLAALLRHLGRVIALPAIIPDGQQERGLREGTRVLPLN